MKTLREHPEVFALLALFAVLNFLLPPTPRTGSNGDPLYMVQMAAERFMPPDACPWIEPSGQGLDRVLELPGLSREHFRLLRRSLPSLREGRMGILYDDGRPEGYRLRVIEVI